MKIKPQFLVSSPRWDILACLTHGHLSATSISKHTNLSLAHISQQLNLLEAHGIIKLETGKKRSIGKPPKEYSLVKEKAIIGYMGAHSAALEIITPTPEQHYLLNTILLSSQDCYTLQKFFYTYEQLFELVESIGLLNKTKEGINLFVISEHIVEIRKKYSNITIKGYHGKDEHINLWSHSLEESKEGILNKEQYFLEKAEQAKELWDPNQKIKSIKELMQTARNTP